MTMRTAIAIMLGLLFQWAQVAQSAVRVETCREIAVAQCDCCADLPSCPCASDSDDSPPPLPVLPDTLKLPAVPPAHARVETEEPPVPDVPRNAASHPADVPASGYAGVRLSVAYCSFVM